MQTAIGVGPATEVAMETDVPTQMEKKYYIDLFLAWPHPFYTRGVHTVHLRSLN